MPRTVKVPEDFLPVFELAENFVSAYFRLKKEAPERGHIDIKGERYILVRAASLSVEFYDLMNTLYGGREDEAFSMAKNLLFLSMGDILPSTHPFPTWCQGIPITVTTYSCVTGSLTKRSAYRYPVTKFKPITTRFQHQSQQMDALLLSSLLHQTW